MKIVKSDDLELVEEIERKLEENREKYGKRYCPCRLDNTDDTVCMCKEFRDQESGECHCGLYVKM